MDGVEGVIQRRNIFGRLDIHPSRKAILVHYAAEAVVTTDYGESVVAESKECIKIINVKNLSRSTNTSNLAQHIVTTCQLIDPTCVGEVEQLLLYLQARKTTKEGEAEKNMLEASTKKLQKQIENIETSEDASMVELDVYLEGLYDDLSAKTKSTGLILQLARLPENLIELASNDSLLLALSRVLRDDWKKSIDLTTNIIYIFFCLSTFSDFHRLLTQHKIGSLCMSVVEHELKRHQTLADDVAKRRKEVKTGDVSADAKKEYEKAKKKYQSLSKKQDTLLRVCLYLLCNLAEDTHVELKMHSKGLVQHLLALLERDNVELLILVVSFLKKMSIFKENKDEMAEGNLIKKLFRIFPNKNEILMNVTLRLLLNLSFDPALRQAIVREAFLPKLTVLLGSESHGTVVLCILYHISFDPKSRAVFAYTDCIPKLMKMILEYPEDRLEMEVIALGINLASTQFGAQQICKGPGLKMLMRRGLTTGDPLLFKMLRNISHHQGPLKKLFLAFIPDLVKMMKEGVGEAEEGAVEAVGILGNLNIPELDFGKIVNDLQLSPFLTGKLKDHNINDDMLLEIIILCGTFSQDETCASLLVQAGLPHLLITRLSDRQEEDELVLQIVYVFYHLVLHKTTRHTVLSTSRMNDTEVPDYLLELMSDKNKAISKLCIKTLDIIAEENSELGQKVKSNRFRWHNCNWLEKVTGETFYDEEDESDDEEDDYYYLDHYLLHSAAELDNPDYFYHGPDTTIPMEDGGNFDRPGYPLSTEQYYGTVGQVEGTLMQPPGTYYNQLTPYPPQNSPFPSSSDYERELNMYTSGNGVRESGNAENNPLASPGMLFDREPDEDLDSVFHSSISARQLMPAMEDPLAMYSASFKDIEENHDYDADSVRNENFATSMNYPTGFTVMDRQRDRRQSSHQTSVDDRVGF